MLIERFVLSLMCVYKVNLKEIVGVWYLKRIFTSSYFNIQQYHYTQKAFYYAHDVIKIDFIMYITIVKVLQLKHRIRLSKIYVRTIVSFSCDWTHKQIYIFLDRYSILLLYFCLNYFPYGFNVVCQKFQLQQS